MPHILALTTTVDDSDGVRAVTAALARTLHLTADQRELPSGSHDVAAAVLLAVDDPTVRLAVLPYGAGDAARLVTEFVRHCPKPVALIPAGCRTKAPEFISRIMVPLDGTIESAEAVAETVGLFAASGTDIVVLHVFDQTTVPKFWDQAAHARQWWDQEFNNLCSQQHGGRPEAPLADDQRTRSDGSATAQRPDPSGFCIPSGWR